MTSVTALGLSGVKRSFRQGRGQLDVLKGIDLTLKPGDVCALLGHSGSGKSTLLQIAGLLESPDDGEVVISGISAGRLDDRDRTRLRRHEIGFIYQFHHLLPEFSALENVVVPQLIAGQTDREARRRGKELLGYLGLGERFDHRPAELSGGEQQRVAIARAVANGPALLLADEPTGNLDTGTADVVFGVLTGLVSAVGLAALVATHNPDLASRMPRRVSLNDGVLHEA